MHKRCNTSNILRPEHCNGENAVKLVLQSPCLLAPGICENVHVLRVGKACLAFLRALPLLFAADEEGSRS